MITLEEGLQKLKELDLQPEDAIDVEMMSVFLDSQLRYKPRLEAAQKNISQLRQAIAQFTFELVPSEEGAAEIIRVIKAIRNDEMRITSWNYICHERDLKLYQTYLYEYATQVRDRIANFLGYYPELNASMKGEVYLRHMMSYDTFDHSSTPNEDDYKVMTTIKYREVMFEGGKTAADAAPLWFAKELCFSKEI